MSWADMMKAAAVAAGRRAPASQTVVGAPWTWNPRDVWLARVRLTRESVVESSGRGTPTPPRQDSSHSG
jgi:hypothetical protein